MSKNNNHQNDFAETKDYEENISSRKLRTLIVFVTSARS